MGSVMAEDSESLVWSVELEVSLFHAMRNHKPVGVNKHFQMASIQDKLISSSNRHITAQQIWKHLATMFDLGALNESEILPFPNKQEEFCLPDDFISKDTASETASNVSLDDISTGRDRHESGSSTRGSMKSEKIERSTPSHKSSTPLLDDSRSEDHTPTTTKRDGRKRTRHSLQSNESTPKRQRRN